MCSQIPDKLLSNITFRKHKGQVSLEGMHNSYSIHARVHLFESVHVNDITHNLMPEDESTEGVLWTQQSTQ